MEKHYPYRFKTEEEFVKEFGNDWAPDRVDWAYPDMNYLFGMPFPYDDFQSGRYTFGARSWHIDSKMITKNKKTKPSYKPKTFLYE